MRKLVVRGGYWRPVVLTVALFFSAPSTAEPGADPAAYVVTLNGEGFAKATELTRRLSIGDSISKGETIRTGDFSRLSLRFTDNAELHLGPGTEVRIAEWATTKHEGRMELRIFRGLFRFITGAIGAANHDKVLLYLPVATIGIRGTHFGARVESTRATIVLLDQVHEGPNGIEVSNFYGAVSLEQPGYGTEIPDAFSPPSPPRRLRLSAIENLARSVLRTPGLR